MNTQVGRLGFNAGLLILAFVALLNVAALPGAPNGQDNSIPLNEVARLVKAGAVQRLTVTGDTVEGEKVDGSRFVSNKEPGVSLLTTLQELGVNPEHLEELDIQVKASGNEAVWFMALILYGGVVFAIVYVFLTTPVTLENSTLPPLSENISSRYMTKWSRSSFDDVAGQKEAKVDLQETIDFLRRPQRFARVGAHMPRGLLLIGPPGCGKTLLAKAVAGEAGVPFIHMSGSDFVEIFVGVGAARVRELFRVARQNTPCIVFIDEIDAVGRHRGRGTGAGIGEREQTLNQILVEMDGFDQRDSVIVLAATNRPDILDPALLRPGRFDRRIMVDLPDRAEREAILLITVQGKPLDSAVDLGIIAAETPGFSGADLANVVNESAILAARRGDQVVRMDDFQEAVEKVRSGPECTSRVLNPSEREAVAFHEAGHALARTLLPGCDPVYKVSIVRRGSHLGYTVSLPQADTQFHTRSQLKDELAALLAGRTAEEMNLGRVSTYAADDLEQATALAREMVTRLGMSDTLGPIAYDRAVETTIPGIQVTRRYFSQATARLIDAEVAALITHAHRRVRELLTYHSAALVRLARKLLEVETLSGPEVIDLIAVATESSPLQEGSAHHSSMRTVRLPLDCPPSSRQ